MAHIHTEVGQIDTIAEAFIVYKNKVLIRFHDKYKIWIAPGGHVELDETPEQTAVREAKEETGLDIELYRGNMLPAEPGDGRFIQLVPPMFMNVHEAIPGHRHLIMAYFALSQTDEVIQPDNHEKAECRWMTAEEVTNATDMEEAIKSYALKALEALSS